MRKTKKITSGTEAGVDRQVKSWERILRKAHGRTRAVVVLLSGAAIIGICGALLCVNSPPARTSVERFSDHVEKFSAHAARATIAALEPSVAHVESEPLPRAPHPAPAAPADTSSPINQ